MCRGSAFAYRNAAVPLGKDIGGVIAHSFRHGRMRCGHDSLYGSAYAARNIARPSLSPCGNSGRLLRAEQGPFRPAGSFLLDLGLPDMDGLQVIQQLRAQTRRPIIILSARAQENEKVLALDYGADDYVTKPFGAKELKAHIRSALRHTYISQESESLGRYRYICGPLTVDYQLERVFKNGEDMRLTNIEYQIVALISRIRQGADVSNHNRRHMGPVCGRGKQPHTAREHGEHPPQNEENPAAPKYIFTEVGVGYRMAPEKAARHELKRRN